MFPFAIGEARMEDVIRLRLALREQYHAGLKMLADCVEKCPDDEWLKGTPPRSFWRIAFHAVFYTHLYMGQDEESAEAWRV